MLIHLIYASTAARPMNDAELLALLQKSRTNNAKRGIRGMLLYQDGNFLQVLEGEESVVTEVYERIEQDPRHYDVSLIMKRPISDPMFDEWEMGFTNLDAEKDDLQEVPGYTDFLAQPFDPAKLSENPSKAFIFLNTFRAFGLR
ncbi:MAG: BLUF domain-containing protein [bacterium]|nr:BLUF domain-containing protein [bacterium]